MTSLKAPHYDNIVHTDMLSGHFWPLWVCHLFRIKFLVRLQVLQWSRWFNLISRWLMSTCCCWRSSALHLQHSGWKHYFHGSWWPSPCSKKRERGMTKKNKRDLSPRKTLEKKVGGFLKAIPLIPPFYFCLLKCVPLFSALMTIVSFDHCTYHVGCQKHNFVISF